MAEPTYAQLLEEVEELRARIAVLEHGATGRSRAEEARQLALRVIEARGRTNQAVVYATDEEWLYQRVCQVVVDVAGYRMAWIGRLAETGEVRPVARAGYASSAEDDDAGPAGEAIRTGRPTIRAHIPTDSRYRSWWDDAARRRYASLISLPFGAKGATFGALTIYASEPGAFGVEEVRRLAQLADDLGYGVLTLQAKVARADLQEEADYLRKQLVQAQKMEALGNLAAGVAHDFNNLLSVILGQVELAIMDIGYGGPGARPLSEVQRAAQRAAILTRQLLLFSHDQAVEFEPLDMARALGDIGSMLRRLIGEDIGLDVEVAGELWPVYGDRGMLSQVLLNIAVNARDAMPTGGRLVLGADAVVLDEETCRRSDEARPGRFVRISVTDTGFGMDDSTVERIFEPFFTTKGPERGSGLGLSVAYGIVRQHGGWITVSSQLGTGTAFRVYLPAAGDGPLPEQPARSVVGAERGGGEKVLLVEDDDGVREVTGTLFARSGYRVREVGTVADALVALEEEPFDLVFSDLVLPDRSGADLAAVVEQRWPDVAVLLTSGYTGERVELHTARPWRLLRKPYRLTELLAAVREALDHGTAP